MTSTQIGSLKIKVTQTDIATQPWSDDFCYHHTIKLINTTSNQSMITDYYGSVNDYKRKQPELSDIDLLDAAQMVIEDALSSENYTLPEFLEEFGYLKSGESALKGINVYNKCAEMFKKLDKMYTPNELEEITNLLYEKLNE
jgi:hypothetical protein